MQEVLDKPKTVKKQILRVLPYIDPTMENMGLEQYGMVVHDGATQKEWLTSLDNNGVRRFLSGLNEFAPEVQSIRDKDEKAAAILEIRKKVQFLERTLGANDVDIDDPKFMEKVKTVHPNNYAFWDNIFIEAGNEPVFLDPEIPNDLIRICGIKAGGFSLVAKSYEDAKLASKVPKFYLDHHDDTAASKVEVKKLKNKAATLLNTLNDKDHKKLFYIVKNIDPNCAAYTSATSSDVIYDYLDEHITGKGFQKSAKKAAEEFIKISSMSIEDLKIKAVIGDAHFYRSIYAKSDGLLYHAATDSRLGRNAEEVLGYFKDPMNAKIWETVRKEIESKWND